MTVSKKLRNKALGLLVCSFISIAAFSQVPGIDPNTDVREVTDNDINGLPATSVNLDWLATQINNSNALGNSITKFYIGSNAVITDKVKGLPRVSFDNNTLLALVEACKAYKLSAVEFQVASITNQQDIDRNFKRHADLSPNQKNLLAGKKTILIKVPAAVLTGKPSTAGSIAMRKYNMGALYAYVEIGSLCPPPVACN